MTEQGIILNYIVSSFWFTKSKQLTDHIHDNGIHFISTEVFRCIEYRLQSNVAADYEFEVSAEPDFRPKIRSKLWRCFASNNVEA